MGNSHGPPANGRVESGEDLSGASSTCSGATERSLPPFFSGDFQVRHGTAIGANSKERAKPLCKEEFLRATARCASPSPVSVPREVFSTVFEECGKEPRYRRSFMLLLRLRSAG